MLEVVSSGNKFLRWDLFNFRAAVWLMCWYLTPTYSMSASLWVLALLSTFLDANKFSVLKSFIYIYCVGEHFTILVIFYGIDIYQVWPCKSLWASHLRASFMNLCIRFSMRWFDFSMHFSVDECEQMQSQIILNEIIMVFHTIHHGNAPKTEFLQFFSSDVVHSFVY